MTSQTLSLNLIPKGICPRLYVSQYDKGQEWNFDIYAGTEAYTIPSGSAVTIQGTKPDKTGFQYACSFSGNRVTATEQQQMTIIAGEVPAEIRIEKNNEIIATLNFIIAVEKAALADDTVISETDLPLIEEAIEVLGHADELVSQIQGYATTAQNAASTATTKASQASTSATNASNSASTASNAATTATNKASEATTAASTATTKASQASTSATSAAGSASTATTKAQEAAASAAAAAQSASHLTIDSTMSTTSENALQNKVVTSAIQNIANQVNYNTNNGVKNLFKIDIDRIKNNNHPNNSSWSNNTFTYYSGTFTFTEDSITFGGTPTANAFMNIDVDAKNIPPAKYMLSGFSSVTNAIVGVVTLYNSGTAVKSYSLATKNNSELDFTGYTYDTVRFEIKRNANNVAMSGTAKPMLCRKDLWDADNTYENYAESNAVLTQKTTGLIDNQNVNSAVNFHRVLNTSQVINGITWTVNDDETVTANGTATADSVFRTQSKSAATAYYDAGMMNAIAGKTIRFSGCPKNGSSSTYFLRLYIANDGGSKDDFGDGYNRTISSNFPNLNFSIECIVKSGQTVSNLVFKPMISVASLNLNYDDYVPYAKSNKELTEDKVEYTNITPYVENGATASQALSAKTIVARNGKLFIVENDISSGDTLVEGGNLGNAKTINDIYSMLMANATYRRKTQGIGNHTKLKMSIPNSVLGNNAIINVKLWGQNSGKYFNSVVMVQCNSTFTNISRTHVKNLDDNAIAIDSATIGSSVTEIVVSGFPTYIALGLEYMTSYSKPYVDWTFYGVD